MGEPTAFLKYPRKVSLAERQPGERLADWEDFHKDLDERALTIQASRCMECGVPFCHSGALIGGMASGCPLHNLIPEFNDLVYRNFWQKAYLRLSKTNNFPEFTGHVCPAPCEGACTLGNHPMPQPTTIKNVEYSIIEKAWEAGWVQNRTPATRSGRKVAIIGSGPSGLAAADQLNALGHTVTVFERADRPGGLLMYGIPNMKLDKKKVLLRRIKHLEAEGVTFVCNASVGSDAKPEFTPENLLATHDAVLLCAGATQPRDLAVEGRSLAGVHFAMDYLSAATKTLLDEKSESPPLNAKGKDVIIIGGGDTGTDCVATALRQGCKSVHQIEIMPEAAKARQPGNPWPEFPKILKVDYGQEEAIARQGADPRTYETTVKKFAADAQGKLTGLHTVQVKWTRSDKGQFLPTEQVGTEKELPAQLALLAMGFLGPEQNLLKAFNLTADSRSNIKTDNGKHTTSNPRIFAAGDCRRGQSLVVWAISEGRAAAEAVDTFLQGK
ncbi:MAG: glutamate synthase subunit beta [Puniceicoccales bacterium]|jgi:glutamate synthase (NADPH/NADH) small chain|nr:glutamate synthase subunit beta [Puniceicoccales bacterium]